MCWPPWSLFHLCQHSASSRRTSYKICRSYAVLISELVSVSVCVCVLTCCFHRGRCLCCWLPLLFSNLIWLEFIFLSSLSFFSFVSFRFFVPSRGHAQKARWALILFQAVLVYPNGRGELTSVHFIMDSYHIQPAMHAEYDSVMKQRARIVLCKCHIFIVSATFLLSPPHPQPLNILHTFVSTHSESNSRFVIFKQTHASVYDFLHLADCIWLLLLLISLKYSKPNRRFRRSQGLQLPNHICASSFISLQTKPQCTRFPMATAANSYLLEKNRNTTEIVETAQAECSVQAARAVGLYSDVAATEGEGSMMYVSEWVKGAPQYHHLTVNFNIKGPWCAIIQVYHNVDKNKAIYIWLVKQWFKV